MFGTDGIAVSLLEELPFQAARAGAVRAERSTVFAQLWWALIWAARRTSAAGDSAMWCS